MTTVLRIEYASQDEKARKLIAILSAMGYTVERTTLPAVTVSELAQGVGRRTASVSRSLRRYGLANIRHERGKGKQRTRILRLWPTPNLIDYLKP